MSYKRLILAVVLIGSFNQLFSQEQKITSVDIVANAKVFFLNQNTAIYTASQVQNFLANKDNYEVLASKGFPLDIVFIKLKIRGNFEAVRKEKISDSTYVENKVPFSCDYIVACKLDGKKFFRLKGFEINDFNLLINEKYTPKQRLAFLNKFWVSELDMACLFDSFFGKKKTNNKNCMQSCIERDRQFIKIQAD